MHSRRLCSREPSSNNGADNRGHDEDAEHHADGDAAEEAAIAVDLSAHGGSDQLLEHGAWVQRERNTANRRWQERVRVGLFSRISDLVLFGVVDGDDFDGNTDETIVFHLAIVTLRAHGEEEGVSILLPLHGLVTLLLQVAFVVLLVDSERTLCQRDILKRLLKVKHAAPDDVVALEEVSVVGLKRETVVLSGVLLLEEKTVIEASLASLATVMAIGLERVLVVEECLDEDI